MSEPSRIGLTHEANEYLGEMLQKLNEDRPEDKDALIKFDLYRLAVALGVKNGIKPPPIEGKTDSNFRVNELDEDGALYAAVDASGICTESKPVYQCIEELAEYGIRQFYDASKSNLIKIPWDQLLS